MPQRKVNSNAKLKAQLPKAQQAALFAYLEEHSYDEALVYARDVLHVQTSKGALCEFRQCYGLQQELQSAAGITDLVKDVLKEIPQLAQDDKTVSRIGQQVFEAIALKRQDAKLFIGLKRLRISESNSEREGEKWRAEAQDKIDLALEAFKAELQGNAAALAAYEEFRTKIKTALEKKAA